MEMKIVLSKKKLGFKVKASERTLKWLFDLVSLFNGISTFVNYLMPKLSLQKNNSDTI